MMQASFFRRSPLLVPAVALIALAVLLVPGSPPAQAGHGTSAPVLSELFITGTVTRDGETYTFPLVANPVFDPHTSAYTIRVPNDLQSITFTPTWTDNTVSSVLLKERSSGGLSLGNVPAIATISTSGGTLTNSSSPSYPALHVVKTTGGGSNDGFHYFNLEKISATSPSFDTTTVDDRTYTAGHEISFLDFSEEETDALRLPKASVEYYSGEITYEATGLPDGLSLGQGRLIIGTPTAKTDTPAEVDYTATDEIGGSVTLHFHVTVEPPVEFVDEAEVRTFKNTIFEYTVDQETPINVTLPEAEGGHGTLTYGLSYWVKETRTVDGRQVTGHWEHSINDDAPGFSFNSATRTLTSDTGATAPSEAAFYSVDYWAEDENGARVIASNSITVNEAPTLPRIAWPTWTVGDSVSLTLPEAEGGTRVGVGIRYELEGVDLSALGLSFNGRTRTISGTVAPAVQFGVSLTYTATDRNGVDAVKEFYVTIQGGPSAPSAAPDLSTFIAATERGRQIVFLDWADVARATSYVVQVIADDGTEFPALVVGVLPDEGSLTVYDSQTDLGGGRTAHALVSGLTAGDYIVRVSAKSAGGVGPWSNVVKFTVPVGGI